MSAAHVWGRPIGSGHNEGDGVRELGRGRSGGRHSPLVIV